MIVAPANAARIAGTDVTLEWTQPADDLPTQVQVAIDEAFTAIVVDETTNEESYTVMNLELGRTYFWRAATVSVSGVKPTDGTVQANSDWTDTRSFTMVPTAPVLTSPADQSVIDDPSGMVQFTWTPTTIKSHVQVSTDVAFSAIVKELETEESTVEYTLDAGQAPYYWRVRNMAANNEAGEWSTTNMFTFGVVSVSEDGASPVTVGPNPTSTRLDIRFASGLFYQVMIMDLQGRTRSTSSIAPELETVQLSVADLESGTYQLVLVGRSGSVTTAVHVLR